ncbi:5'/3'-nucleotidase SurE [Desulfobacula sp.]|uniref:5'/3'-nucleotidase SurE n=1 Tax=Desulfobacula sp. TaxID=2593537 RepID=UPI002606D7F6|nr:5'/3'-nucleotidase SurE [Desulfobacula sp.]
MKILLTNDDGYNAPGIQVLYETLRFDHEIVLIAPERERSAVSHSLTLHKPLRMNPIPLKGDDTGYIVTGTPSDCVKLGLFELFSTPPDLVISGINSGCNLGIDINYSGTVAAAREGALNGVFSMAVSIKQGKVVDFKGVSGFIATLVNTLHDDGLPFGTFLNINAPDLLLTDMRGIKITRQASKNLSRQFEKRVDPKNRPYYWYSTPNQGDGEPDTDVTALSQNHISITPIQCDITDYKTIAELKPLLYKTQISGLSP